MWLAYAVVAMVTIGGADFAAALAGRSVVQARQVLAIASLQQGISLAPLAVAAAFVVKGDADAGDFGWAVAAGVAFGVAKPLLYAGLTFGSIVVFLPTTGVVSIVVPFTVSVARGEGLGAWGFLGIAVAMPAVVLVGMGTAPDTARWSMPRVLVAALATGTIFGLSSLAIGEMDEGAGLAPALVAAAVAFVMIAVVYGVVGRPIAVRSAVGGWVTASGLLEGVGFAFFTLAVQRGLVSVSSALLAMAPVVAVVLAWLFIHEVLGRRRLVGIGLAVLAVVALSVD